MPSYPSSSGAPTRKALVLVLALALVSCGFGDRGYAVVVRNELGQAIRYVYDDTADRATELGPGEESGDLWTLANTNPDGGPRRTLRAYAGDGALLYCASFSTNAVAKLEGRVVLAPGKTDCR